MKKIISLVLVLALAVSLFVLPVSAADFTGSVEETDRFYDAVKFMDDNNIFQDSDCTGVHPKVWLEGDTTRGEYATWLARFAGAAQAAAVAEGAEYVLDTTNDLAEMAAGTKADGDTETVADYFTIHYGEKTKIDGSKKSFEDGYEATQRLNFQGKTSFGDVVKYAVSFTTASAATVKIWWVAGGDGREFTLFDANGNALSATSVGAVKNSLYISELSVDAAGTYYLGLESGSNYLFKLSVAEKAASEETDLVFADMGNYVGTELYNAVAWGKENGYINGYADGNFYPEKPVSREEICAMFARFCRANGWLGLKETENITVFMDQEEFSAYTIEEKNVVDCVKYGLIQGRETGRFDAKNVCNGEVVNTTRQQMAAIFYRAAGNQVHTTKAYVEIESAGELVFSMRANKHYTLLLKVTDGVINTKNLGVDASVSALPSVGLDAAKSLHRKFNTGIDFDIELKNFLGNAYEFEGATVNVDVNGITFTYNVWGAFIDEEDGLTTIAFLPDDVAAVREAWNAMADTGKLTKREGGDTYATLTNGSSIQIGETLVEFKRGESDWTISEFNGADALKAEFDQKIKVDTDSDAKIELVLEKGIAAAYGTREVTLENDVTVTVEGIYAYELGEALMALYENGANTDNIENLGLELIEAIDALFGEMSGSVIDVTVVIE